MSLAGGTTKLSYAEYLSNYWGSESSQHRLAEQVANPSAPFGIEACQTPLRMALPHRMNLIAKAGNGSREMGQAADKE
jgi:hypothetical protein